MKVREAVFVIFQVLGLAGVAWCIKLALAAGGSWWQIALTLLALLFVHFMGQASSQWRDGTF